MPETIRPGAPGRFATQIDAYIYALAQEGLHDEFTAKDGGWYGLLRSDAATPLYDPSVETDVTLNEAEQRFLLPKAGAIIEDLPGLHIKVDYFEREGDLQATWDALHENKAEVAHEEDMLEIPEGEPASRVTDELLTQAKQRGHEDGLAGAGPGSTPAMAVTDAWAAAGVAQDTRPDDFGLLVDAWRQGVYLGDQQRGQKVTSARRIASGEDVTIKALSVKQPWANLIASGQKTIETRTWGTAHRGPLLIVSSKDPDIPPAGAAIALVDLVDCHPMTPEDETAAQCPPYPGAWAWVFDNIVAIKDPIPMTGARKLFDAQVPASLLHTPFGLPDSPSEAAPPH